MVKKIGSSSFTTLVFCSEDLAKIVGNKPLPRVEVTKKLWDYIRKNCLQDTRDRRMINCDTLLQKLCKQKQVSMFGLAKIINDNTSLKELEVSKTTRVKLGDMVEITGNSTGHGFPIGDKVEIYRIPVFGDISARNAKANWRIGKSDFKLATQKPSTQMATNTDAVRKGLVLACAQTLLSPNNTVSTLEIKTELRKKQPAYYWTQDVVSKIMDEFSQNGTFTYTDNGTFRTYSDPTRTRTVTRVSTPKVKTKATKKATSSSPKQKFTSTITKAQARKLMENNKGHFFTATFTKTDGTTRVMNCQYLSGQSFDKSLVKVREACLMKDGDNAIRQIALDRLQSLKIAGGFHKVGKK